MATLNKLTCTILLPPTDTPLPEYKRRYLDSSVSVYVPVPDIPILHAAPAFNIQLCSDDEWIAPGLAMFVYIDGYYQCNRSKRTPEGGSSKMEFRVRQKEEKVAGGVGEFVGREWRWVGLGEQANGASAASKDQQDHVGKIEVVVLRCDAEPVLVEEPRARAQPASAAKASVKAPSAKAPSAKAPSAKVPSTKAPSATKPASAAGDPFGGIGPLFPPDYAGRIWDPVDACYKSPKPASKSITAATPSRSFGMDGQGHDYPAVVVNQYGQQPGSRVPYYHATSARKQPRPEHHRHGHGRPVNAAIGYVQAGAMSAPPLGQGQGQQVVGFAQNGAPVYAQPNMVHIPQGQQAQGFVQQPGGVTGPQGQQQYIDASGGNQPRIIVGPDGQYYMEVSGQQQAHAPRPNFIAADHEQTAPAPQNAPQQAPAPQAQQQHGQQPRVIIGPDGQHYIDVSGQQQNQPHGPAFMPAGQGQTAPAPPNAPQQAPALQPQPQTGYQVYTNPTTGAQYLIQGNGGQQYPAHQQQIQPQQQPQQQQHQFYQTLDPVSQQLQMIDPEYQRAIIFELGHGLTKALGHDYRLVAAAVPHIPLLQRTPIGELNDNDEKLELKRQLDQILSQRHFPNGDKIVPMVDHARDAAAKEAKMPTKRNASGSKPGKQQAYDDLAEDSDWRHEDKNKTPTKHDRLRSRSKKRHEKRDDKADDTDRKQEGSGIHKHRSKRDDKRESGSRNSGNSSSGVDHFAGSNKGKSDGGKSHRSSEKPQSQSKKSSSSSSSGGWTNNGGENAKPASNANWDNNAQDNNDQTNQAADGWGTPSNDQQKTNDAAPIDGNSERKPSRSKAPSSHHSKSSTTTNPHADLQSYFQVLRGAGQPSTTKPLHHQPREPYVYPAAQTPHVSPEQIGDRSHGVRAGKGADYSHKTRRPKYLDSMENPYAVFVFKYRSAEKLEEILGKSVKGDLAQIAEEVGRGVLLSLPKDRLVDELMKSQAMAAAGGGNGEEAGHRSQKGGSDKAASQAGKSSAGQDNAWRHPKAASVAKSAGKDWGNSKAASAAKGDAGTWGGDPFTTGNNAQQNAWDNKSAKKSDKGGDWAPDGAGKTIKGGKDTPSARDPGNLQFSSLSNLSSRMVEFLKLPVVAGGKESRDGSVSSTVDSRKANSKDDAEDKDRRMW